MSTHHAEEKSVVIAAVKETWVALYGASDKWKKDPIVRLAAVKQFNEDMQLLLKHPENDPYIHCAKAMGCVVSSKALLLQTYANKNDEKDNTMLHFPTECWQDLKDQILDYARNRITDPYEREQWLATVYKTAKEKYHKFAASETRFEPLCFEPPSFEPPKKKQKLNTAPAAAGARAAPDGTQC